MLTNLPHFSASEIGVLNALFMRNGQIHLELMNEDYRFDFLDRPVFFTSQIVCEISVNQYQYSVGLSDFFFKDYLEEKFPEVKLNAVPEILKRPLFEVFFEELIGQFEEWSKTEVKITSWSLKPKSYPGKAGKMSEIPFSLTSSDAGHVIMGALSCDLPALLQLQSWVSHYPPIAHSYSDLTIGALVVLGDTQLDLRQFKELAIGDVLLFSSDMNSVFDTIPLYLSSSFAFEGEIKDNKFTLNYYVDDPMTQDLHTGDLDDAFDLSLDNEIDILPETKSPKKSSKSKSTEKPPVDIESLPIHLKFSLASLKIPLSELESLAPGYVFDLQQPLSGPIDIRANGHVVGTGELVQVEDHIGVKITKLYR